MSYSCFESLFYEIRTDNIFKVLIQNEESLVRVLIKDYKYAIIILLSYDFEINIYRLELSEISSHIGFC